MFKFLDGHQGKLILVLVLASYIFSFYVPLSSIYEVKKSETYLKLPQPNDTWKNDANTSKYLEDIRINCRGSKVKPRRTPINRNIDFYNLSCSKPVVSIQGRGRLGNQICEYLSLAYLQENYGIQAALDIGIHNSMSNLFDSVKMSRDRCPNNKKRQISISELHEKLYTSNKDSPYIIPSHYSIKDYPCFFDALIAGRHLFTDLVKISDKFKNKANEMIKQMIGWNRMKKWKEKRLILVSIHVRRSDFTLMLRKYNKDRKFLTPCYFHSAMNFFRERFKNVIFVVGGSDRSWNEKYLSGPDIVHTKYSPMQDLAIYSTCDHHILSMGTFTFVSGFLGNSGIIVHPFVIGKSLIGMEKAFICKNDTKYVAIPDCGTS